MNVAESKTQMISLEFKEVEILSIITQSYHCLGELFDCQCKQQRRPSSDDTHNLKVSRPSESIINAYNRLWYRMNIEALPPLNKFPV